MRTFQPLGIIREKEIRGKREALTAHISTLMFHHDLTRGLLGVFFVVRERITLLSGNKPSWEKSAPPPSTPRSRGLGRQKQATDRLICRLPVYTMGWVDAGKRLWICNTPNGRLSYDLVSAGYCCCWRTARSNYPVMAWLAGEPEFSWVAAQNYRRYLIILL